MVIESHIENFISNKVIDRLLNKPKFIEFGCVVIEIFDILSTAIIFATHCIYYCIHRINSLCNNSHHRELPSCLCA